MCIRDSSTLGVCSQKRSSQSRGNSHSPGRRSALLHSRRALDAAAPADAVEGLVPPRDGASGERRAAAEQEQRSTGGPGLMDPTDNPMQLVDQAPDQHETTSRDLGGADLAAEQLAAAARSEHEGLDLRDDLGDQGGLVQRA